MAGVSTKEIKSRIRSMESTKQITKAMEMVAASKLRRAQTRIASSRPYFEILYSVIQDIASVSPDASMIYIKQPSEKKCRMIYIVIGGDRGLAGGYNSNIFKHCYAEIQNRDVTVLPVGRKSLEFFHARQIPLYTENFIYAEGVTISDCFTIARKLCHAYLAGECDEIRIGYTGFESVLSQKPVSMRLLPLEAPAVRKETRHDRDILYEPDITSVFEAVIPEYLGGVIYGALCESRASEQAARRTAMDAATQNAEDMIADLSLKFNQARQASITQEITEIVAGS